MGEKYEPEKKIPLAHYLLLGTLVEPIVDNALFKIEPHFRSSKRGAIEFISPRTAIRNVSIRVLPTSRRIK